MEHWVEILKVLAGAFGLGIGGGGIVTLYRMWQEGRKGDNEFSRDHWRLLLDEERKTKEQAIAEERKSKEQAIAQRDIIIALERKYREEALENARETERELAKAENRLRGLLEENIKLRSGCQTAE